MTNELFQVAMMVLWSTNVMDTLLTPVGDDIIRSTIASQTHVYSLPGGVRVTNTVPVLTNSVHLRRAWMDVGKELPPVPDLSQLTADYFLDKVNRKPTPMKSSVMLEPSTNTASTPGVFRSTIQLEWDRDDNEVDVFKLYTSSDLSIPLTNWTQVATVSGEVHSVMLSNIAPQQAWFYVTASNWWGETGPSNVDGTPPIPSDERKLTIGP